MTSIEQDDNIQGNLEESADMSLEFLKCWGLFVPTICCCHILSGFDLHDCSVEIFNLTVSLDWGFGI